MRVGEESGWVRVVGCGWVYRAYTPKEMAVFGGGCPCLGDVVYWLIDSSDDAILR